VRCQGVRADKELILARAKDVAQRLTDRPVVPKAVRPSAPQRLLPSSGMEDVYSEPAMSRVASMSALNGGVESDSSEDWDTLVRMLALFSISIGQLQCSVKY
jgi:hypothetical protein